MSAGNEPGSYGRRVTKIASRRKIPFTGNARMKDGIGLPEGSEIRKGVP
jgi:hypothetical protein